MRIFILCFIIIFSQKIFGGETTEIFWKQIPLNQVKVEGEIGRRIDLTIQKNLLALKVDKDFLKPFQEQRQKGYFYVGLGKLIDSTVTFSLYSKNKKVLELKNRLIDELIKTQAEDGYMGCFAPEFKLKSQWELHEMVYIIQGLLNNYQSFNHQPSLDSARKLADYIMKNRKRRRKVHYFMNLGLEKAFLTLAKITGEKKYLSYVADGTNFREWLPTQFTGLGDGSHAYNFMNVCLAQLDLYIMEQYKNKNLLATSKKLIDFFTKDDGLLINGTCSAKERFHDTQLLTGTIGETCATAYLLKLLHKLMQLEGKPIYGDIMERAIFNALFAAQSPDGRRLRYFTPLTGKRSYYGRDTFCCPTNFRRIIAELPQMIYYQGKDSIIVNLYTQSSANLKLNNTNVQLNQETDYPNSGTIHICVAPEKPVKFALKLRIPRWCENPQVSVNGNKLNNITSGEFLTVNRLWEKNDKVSLTFPMEIRAICGRKSQKDKVAIMRGPLLFCLASKQYSSSSSSYISARKDEVMKLEINRLHESCKLQHKLLAELQNNSASKNVIIKSKENIKAIQKEVEKIKETLNKDILTIDLDSLALSPVKDTKIRPDGIRIKAKAWKTGIWKQILSQDFSKPPTLTLEFTEFTDPNGVRTYFSVSNHDKEISDELISIRDNNKSK